MAKKFVCIKKSFFQLFIKLVYSFCYNINIYFIKLSLKFMYLRKQSQYLYLILQVIFYSTIHTFYHRVSIYISFYEFLQKDY